MKLDWMIWIIPIFDCFNMLFYRNMDEEIKDFNLALANSQKKEQEFLNNVLYKTKASDDFFEQFNKTTR